MNSWQFGWLPMRRIEVFFKLIIKLTLMIMTLLSIFNLAWASDQKNGDPGNKLGSSNCEIILTSIGVGPIFHKGFEETLRELLVAGSEESLALHSLFQEVLEFFHPNGHFSDSPEASKVAKFNSLSRFLEINLEGWIKFTPAAVEYLGPNPRSDFPNDLYQRHFGFSEPSMQLVSVVFNVISQSSDVQSMSAGARLILAHLLAPQTPKIKNSPRDLVTEFVLEFLNRRTAGPQKLRDFDTFLTSSAPLYARFFKFGAHFVSRQQPSLNYSEGQAREATKKAIVSIESVGAKSYQEMYEAAERGFFFGGFHQHTPLLRTEFANKLYALHLAKEKMTIWRTYGAYFLNYELEMLLSSLDLGLVDLALLSQNKKVRDSLSERIFDFYADDFRDKRGEIPKFLVALLEYCGGRLAQSLGISERQTEHQLRERMSSLIKVMKGAIGRAAIERRNLEYQDRMREASALGASGRLARNGVAVSAHPGSAKSVQVHSSATGASGKSEKFGTRVRIDQGAQTSIERLKGERDSQLAPIAGLVSLESLIENPGSINSEKVYFYYPVHSGDGSSRDRHFKKVIIESKFIKELTFHQLSIESFVRAFLKGQASDHDEVGLKKIRSARRHNLWEIKLRRGNYRGIIEYTDMDQTWRWLALVKHSDLDRFVKNHKL